MLSNRELTQIRADIAELFPDTCNILTLSYTNDGAGGIIEAWGTASADVPCRVDYKTGREAVSGGVVTPFQSAIISMAYNVTIAAANRVEVGDNTFNVTSINNGQSNKGAVRVSAELLV